MPEPRVVKVDGIATLASIAPYLVGHTPEDGSATLLGFAGARMSGPAVHLPEADSPREDMVRDSIREAITTITFNDRAPDRFVLLTWGEFPNHETLAARILESFHGFHVEHGHVADGSITPIYPRYGFPTPIPVAPAEFSLATATPASSFSAHLALWDRTPVQVPQLMVDAAIQDADNLVHSRPLHQILTAARVHLARIVDEGAPQAIRETSIVQVAAVMAADAGVRDAIICNVREDPVLQQGIKQSALHAPSQIAGDVVAATTLFAFANCEMSSQQVQHLLSQAPDTKLGMLVGHSVAVGIPPASMKTLISQLQAAPKVQPSGPTITGPQHEQVSR